MYQVLQVSEKTVLEQKAYMLFYVRDRKNIVPRKPVDFSQKENIKANENRSKTCSTSNQVLTRPVQNGSVEVRSNSVGPFATLSQKDAPNVGPRKISPSNEGSDQPKFEHSQTSLTKDLSERLHLLPKNSEHCLKPSDSPSKNGDACKLETGTATAPADTNDLNEKGSSNKNLTVPVVTSPNLEEIQSSTSAKQTTEKISQEVTGCSTLLLAIASY